MRMRPIELWSSSFSILVHRKQNIEGLSTDRENFTGELLYWRPGNARGLFIFSMPRASPYFLWANRCLSRRSLCVVASCYLCNCYKRSRRTTWKWIGVNIKKPLVFVA